MNRNYANLFLVIVFALSASCATLSDEERYERADKFLQARENFKLQTILCRKAGGTIQMTRLSAMKLARHDYESATCIRRAIG